jgi:hypothetical protein
MVSRGRRSFCSRAGHGQRIINLPRGRREFSPGGVYCCNFFTLAFCHIYASEEIKAMTIHTIPKHTCPSCGGEGEYPGDAREEAEDE